MKNQYKILNELKKVEEKVFRLQTELLRIPREIAKIDAASSAKRTEYEAIKTQLADLEKKQRAAEGDLREKEEGLKKAEAKMMEVKTNEEYQAALKENEGQKAEKGKYEEKVLTFITQAEEARKKAKESETAIAAIEAETATDRAAYLAEQEKLQTHFDELVKKKNAVLSDLMPETVSLYHRLATRLEGQVIAYAENCQCLGCNMRVAPQLYNEMLGFKKIHRCGNCGRILVVKGAEDEALA